MKRVTHEDYYSERRQNELATLILAVVIIAAAIIGTGAWVVSHFDSITVTTANSDAKHEQPKEEKLVLSKMSDAEAKKCATTIDSERYRGDKVVCLKRFNDNELDREEFFEVTTESAATVKHLKDLIPGAGADEDEN